MNDEKRSCYLCGEDLDEVDFAFDCPKCGSYVCPGCEDIEKEEQAEDAEISCPQCDVFMNYFNPSH